MQNIWHDSDQLLHKPDMLYIWHIYDHIYKVTTYQLQTISTKYETGMTIVGFLFVFNVLKCSTWV